MNTQNERDENPLRKGPEVESYMNLSQDGKWFIHKTVFTDIKPVTYIDRVLEGPKEDAPQKSFKKRY